MEPADGELVEEQVLLEKKLVSLQMQWPCGLARKKISSPEPVLCTCFLEFSHHYQLVLLLPPVGPADGGAGQSLPSDQYRLTSTPTLNSID